MGKRVIKEKHFPASGIHFFPFFFCLKKQFLRIVETYFLLNASSGAHKDISKLDIQFLESRYGKSLKSFVHPTQNDGPV